MIIERNKTIELASPLVEGPRKIDALILGAPTIGAKRQAEAHLRQGTQGEAATKFQIAMIAKCAGLLDATVEQLEIDVFNEAWDFVAGFLTYAPETT